jgi:peptidoglycan/xylan/chitin deacetylase (PgdA/CDA1 family)
MRLASVSDDSQARTASLPYAVAEVVRDNGGLRIEIQGTPGATVVLVADQAPISIITLDENGRASIVDPKIAGAPNLEIAALAEPAEPINPPRTLTPTETPTRTPPPTLTITPSMTPGSKPSFTATATKTVATVPTSTSPTPKPTRPSSTRRRVGSKPAVSPPVLHLVTDSGDRIAVTFDGNASSNGTADLLDLLHELDLKITLFVTGGFIERYPTLIRSAVLAGHEVGNHTFSHQHLTTYADNRRHKLLPNVTKKWLHDQLERTEIAFQKATGRPMAPLWRAPYGEENSTLRGWALELGYLHVRWSSLEGASLDARDWVADEHSKLFQDSRKMMDRLLGFPRLEGGIVLMHLSTERSEPPWTELPRFVRELQRRKVEPVKVSDLLEKSKTWRTWLKQARANHERNFPE